MAPPPRPFPPPHPRFSPLFPPTTSTSDLHSDPDPSATRLPACQSPAAETRAPCQYSDADPSSSRLPVQTDRRFPQTAAPTRRHPYLSPIPIHRQRRRLLLRQVDYFKHLCVHQKGQLVALPPRDQLLMLWMPPPVQLRSTPSAARLIADPPSGHPDKSVVARRINVL